MAEFLDLGKGIFESHENWLQVTHGCKSSPAPGALGSAPAGSATPGFGTRFQGGTRRVPGFPKTPQPLRKGRQERLSRAPGASPGSAAIPAAPKLSNGSEIEQRLHRSGEGGK